MEVSLHVAYLEDQALEATMLRLTRRRQPDYTTHCRQGVHAGANQTHSLRQATTLAIYRY
jgi:hypothetical protein